MTTPYGPGLEPGRFFLPGPTEIHDDVLAAQNNAVIGHRGGGIQKLMECLQAGLQNVFRTERPVFIATASATGLMEAGIRNGVRERLLCLVNGAFSKRFADIAAGCEKEFVVHEVPWGQAVDPEDVRRLLSEGGFDAVTVVHSETSTATLNDIPAIASVVREFDDVLFIVDSVTGIGGAEFHTDAWGVDFVVTGSQKALALPPGLSFAVASERMMERARTLPGRGFYFDLVRFEAQLEKLQTPTTPAVTLFYSTAEQLGRIHRETMEARWARHRALSDRTVQWVEETAAELRPGMRVFAAAGHRSPTVTCIGLPESGDGPKVVAGMRERGFVLGGGYGKLKPDAFRIGHMGDHDLAALDLVLEHLTEVLR